MADNNVLQSHLYILLNKKLPKDLDDVEGSDCDLLTQCQFDSILLNISKILDNTYELTAKGFISVITQKLDDIFNNKDDKWLGVLSDVLVYAIAAVQTYIQANVTGPALTFDPNQILTIISSEDELKSFNQSCVESLTCDGEPAFSLMSYPFLLILARTILGYLYENLSCNALQPFIRWWYCRVLILHQSVIRYPSSTLLGLVFDCFTKESTVDTIISSIPVLTSKQKTLLTIRFYCEISRAQLAFDLDCKKIEESIRLAQEASGFSYVLTGLKAKRTKFQRDEASQLIVIAKSDQRKDKSQYEDLVENLPSALELNSDLLLEKPTYSQINENDNKEAEVSFPKELMDIDPNDQPALQDIDNIILILKFKNVRQSTPHKDVLIHEELLATANRIINNPKSSVNWSIFSRALWDRSLLEADSVKTVERGTLQIQSLVEELGYNGSTTYLPKSKDDDSESSNVASRLSYIHQLPILTKWAMDIALAEQFMSLGALKSAVEVYERLDMFSEISLCYAAVGQEEKAIDILTLYLEKQPKDARAWSIMGDITTDPQYWEKSWDIGRYAASKRALGRFFYNPPKSSGTARNLDMAIKHLNESLQVNPLNFDIWFLYGCAGLETAQWELAAEAFTRCVAIEQDDPKSFSNLATALLRLGKKPEAFHALKRAIRVGSDQRDWRVWTNYVTVAADVHEWSEVVRGTKEIINIRAAKEGESILDIDMLERVIFILIDSEYPTGDDPSLTYFQKSCIDLFTNIIPSLITLDYRLWKLVAKVNVWQKKPWLALESYKKGFRIIVKIDATIENQWNKYVDYCGDLVDAYANFGPMEGRFGESSVVCQDWKFEARSAIRSMLGRGKTQWEDSDGWNRLQEMKQSL